MLSIGRLIKSLIKDSDGDTKVEVEQSADEDVVRITAGGTEKIAVDADKTDIPGSVHTRHILRRSPSGSVPSINEVAIRTNVFLSGAYVLETDIDLNVSSIYYEFDFTFYQYTAHTSQNARPGFIRVGFLANSGGTFNENASIMGNYPGTDTVYTYKNASDKLVIVIGETTDTVSGSAWPFLTFKSVMSSLSGDSIDASNFTFTAKTDLSAYTQIRRLRNATISIASPTLIPNTSTASPNYALFLRNNVGTQTDEIGIAFQNGGTLTTGSINYSRGNGSAYCYFDVRESGVQVSRLFLREKGLLGVNVLLPGGQLHSVSNSASTTAVIAQGAASQTANLFEAQNSAGTTLSATKSDGSWQPVTLADSAASNNSVYYSSTQSKLVYKDGGGTVNNLY